ncbi:MAG TPA: alpha/beta hydrolase, partial [Ruminococcaceae bacterium]|nr:alpha/beta hydrolase [Oscillospiraceae bacterium]
MGWDHFNIPNGKSYLFCNAHITSRAAMNIIVTHTPIISTIEMQQAYQPLEKYNVNVFAFDFSGTGKSGGSEFAFSRTSIVNDLDTIADYVECNYSSNIHLYGNTGIGGMFAQYYATKSDRVKSFAQFACVHHKNTAGMGYPYPLAKILCCFLKMLPKMKMTMKPPKYRGYNEEKDNAFYERLEKTHPHIWRTNSKVVQTLLECFVAKDSEAKKSIRIPTLVFKTLHDRYFSPQYFDDYFKSLTCEKKLIEIDDVHN